MSAFEDGPIRDCNGLDVVRPEKNDAYLGSGGKVLEFKVRRDRE